MFKGKKGIGALDGLQSLIVPLVGIALVLTVGFLVMAETQDQICDVQGIGNCDANDTDTTTALNASRDTVTAMSDIPGWLPIIVITVIGAILLSLVAVFRRR